MSDKEVPPVRTAITVQVYTEAVVRSWHLVGSGVPPRGAVGVLWAQFCVETGGVHCWNWNLGNVKKVDGDGHDYHCLQNVWEGVSPAEAQRLISRGEARPDPSSSHAKAVGPNQVSVLFNPPHPQTRFRAFENLTAAMEDHLVFLAKSKFSVAWPAVLSGDCLQFASAIKKKGYFTASAPEYAKAMERHFRAFMKSNAFDAGTGTTPSQLSITDFGTPLAVQRELMAQGYDIGPGGADGVMGAKTRQAVAKFQKANGLVPDGVVGPKTKQALLESANHRLQG